MIVLFLVYVPSGERVNAIKGIICSSILYGGMDGGVCEKWIRNQITVLFKSATTEYVINHNGNKLDSGGLDYRHDS